MPDWSTQYAAIVGVGVIMDNMLYIIAGLVLILLIAGLVLRQKKAQKPSEQSYVESDKNRSTPEPTPSADHDVKAPSNTDNDKKFDHIMIAQRFMDQQRYDKAIETLNRGLIEKPKDNQLSLKLLSIYATINQPEDFNKVYESIQTKNDPESLVLADELKTLFFEEQEQNTVKAAPVKEEAGFESLDFDLSGSSESQNIVTEEPSVDSNTDTAIDQAVDNTVITNDFSTNDFDETDSIREDSSFDLTLSDLESDLNDPMGADDTAPVTSLDSVDDDYTDVSDIESSTHEATEEVTIIEDEDLSDFDFSLDTTAEDDSVTTTSPVADSVDSTLEESALEDDSFVLDLDDLTIDADDDSVEETATTDNLTTDSLQDEQDEQDDLVLSLDSLDESNNLEENAASPAEVSSEMDTFIIEDSGFEDSILDGSDDTPDASDIAPTAPLAFDDDAAIDEQLDSDPLTAATPVDAEPEVATEEDFSTETTVETAEDFSSRFAEDFDFVKSLDSNQVTLDLASQYLQLGEYDSAKRLLNEVIAQGSSEQQSQAQALLARTA